MVRQSRVRMSERKKLQVHRRGPPEDQALWRRGVRWRRTEAGSRVVLCRAAPHALAALHHHGDTWQHPPLSAARAPGREASLLEPLFFLILLLLLPQNAPRFHGVRVHGRREPRLQHWAAIHRHTRTPHSASWRRVRSTRPREAATSFAFLRTLPCAGPQPIRGAAEGSGGRDKGF